MAENEWVHDYWTVSVFFRVPCICKFKSRATILTFACTTSVFDFREMSIFEHGLQCFCVCFYRGLGARLPQATVFSNYNKFKLNYFASKQGCHGLRVWFGRVACKRTRNESFLSDPTKMTLFHFKELWSTNCGTEEEFDKTSLCVCNIDNASGQCGKLFGWWRWFYSQMFLRPDKIITGSFNGMLRVYQLQFETNQQHSASAKRTDNNNFQASDMLLETDLKEPILQITSGVLLASSNIQLAVLHPKKFCVFSISCKF